MNLAITLFVIFGIGAAIYLASRIAEQAQAKSRRVSDASHGAIAVSDGGGSTSCGGADGGGS